MEQSQDRGRAAAAPLSSSSSSQSQSPLPPDEMQRSLTRKRSISALRKATLERQMGSSSGGGNSGGGSGNPSPTGSPAPTASFSSSTPAAAPGPSFGFGARSNPPPHHNHSSDPLNNVVEYMSSLTRAHRLSLHDPMALGDMLRSQSTPRIGEYLSASRRGTLTRSQSGSQSAGTAPALPEPQIAMDLYSAAVYQWMCTLTSSPIEFYPSIAAALRSGDLLFLLAQRLMVKPPTTPPSVDFSDPSSTIHKLIYFLDCCRTANVPETDTFPLTDLMADDGDPRAILRTLVVFCTLVLAKRKRGKDVGPPIPQPPAGYFEGPWITPLVAPRTYQEVPKPPVERAITMVERSSVADSTYFPGSGAFSASSGAAAVTRSGANGAGTGTSAAAFPPRGVASSIAAPPTSAAAASGPIRLGIASSAAPPPSHPAQQPQLQSPPLRGTRAPAGQSPPSASAVPPPHPMARQQSPATMSGGSAAFPLLTTDSSHRDRANSLPTNGSSRDDAGPFPKRSDSSASTAAVQRAAALAARMGPLERSRGGSDASLNASAARAAAHGTVPTADSQRQRQQKPQSYPMADPSHGQGGMRSRLDSDGDMYASADEPAAPVSLSASSVRVHGLLTSLVDHEDLFLQDLQVVTDWAAIVKNPSPNAPALTASEVESLFGTPRALLGVHRSLARQLRTATASIGPVTPFGHSAAVGGSTSVAGGGGKGHGILLATDTNAACIAAEAVAVVMLTVASELLRVYETAALTASSTRALLGDASAGRRPALAAVVREFSLWPRAHGLSLATYLARPAGHLGVYAQLMDELSSAVAALARPEAVQIRRAAEVLASMVQGIDAKVAADSSGPFGAGSHGGGVGGRGGATSASRVPSYLIPMVVDDEGAAGDDSESSESADGFPRPGKAVPVRPDVDTGHGTATLRRNLKQVVDIAALEKPSRRFICQGSVWEIVAHGEVKVRSLLLFQDALVIAKEVQGTNGAQQFEVRNLLELRKVTVRGTRDRARSALRLRPVVAQAVGRFNADPESAVAELVAKRVLDPTVPSNMASFLHKTPNLARRLVGRFIGAPQRDAVANAYADWYSPVLATLSFEDGLRLFLSGIRLGNDGPAIDRVLTAFARSYARANPTRFDTERAAVDLVFSVILLNADIHGATPIGGNDPQSGGPPGGDSSNGVHRMRQPLALRDFVAAHPGVAAGQMHAIYTSIAGEKLHMASDRSHRIAIDVSGVPTHLTLNEASEWIELSIPGIDAGLTLRLITPPALHVEPSIIAFGSASGAAPGAPGHATMGAVAVAADLEHADRQFVRITGTQVGRHRIYFLPSGPSAHKYDYILPLTVTVEPPYMKHTFSIEFPHRADRGGDSKSAPAAAASAPTPDESPRRSVLTFSVATDEQRRRWVEYLQTTIDQLRFAPR
ncbi:hypothetical protein BC828DRAFT_412520 [Blastocladiella britannica]|nr:hypothetical protein BC828DRAFT_412520 [Blastocladiella britannica]